MEKWAKPVYRQLKKMERESSVAISEPISSGSLDEYLHALMMNYQ